MELMSGNRSGPLLSNGVSHPTFQPNALQLDLISSNAPGKMSILFALYNVFERLKLVTLLKLFLFQEQLNKELLRIF